MFRSIAHPLSALSAILLFTAFALWICRYSYFGEWSGPEHYRVTFFPNSEGITAAIDDTYWHLTLHRGRIGIVQTYIGYSDPVYQTYHAPMGFPPDPSLVAQYRQVLNERVRRYNAEGRKIQHSWDCGWADAVTSATGTWLSRRGFQYNWDDFPKANNGTNTTLARGVWFPAWALVLVSAPIPLVRGWGWLRRRRRVGRNLCAACGYDLRASGDRCPECGHPVGEN